MVNWISLKKKPCSSGSWTFIFESCKNLDTLVFGGSDKFDLMDKILNFSRVAQFSIFTQLIYLILEESAGAIGIVWELVTITSFGTDFDSISQQWNFRSHVM